MTVEPALEPDPELERSWTPSSAINGNWQPFAAAYRSGTLAARRELGSQLLSPTVEVYGGRGDAALVFVHGGYWQEQTLDDAGFAALPLAARGIRTVAVSYPLAPSVTVAGIVESVAASLQELAAQLDGLGIDPRRTVVAGHSAGAHLVAKAAIAAGARWPFGTVALVSGVFDPEPLLTTSINGALGLDVVSARMVSALPVPAGSVLPDAVVCWAQLDTAPFHQQSRRLAAEWATTGASVQVIEAVPDRNHFDIVFDLADRSTALGAALFG